MHKDDPSDLNRPECELDVVPDTPIETVYVKLPNEGSDIQSFFSFISNHYNTLATYTIFLPIKIDSITNELMTSLGNPESISAAVNELISHAFQNQVLFLPVMSYAEKRQTLSTQKTTKETATQAEHDSYSELIDLAQETHNILFENKTIQSKKQNHASVVQFIVHKDLLSTRSKNVWENIEDMSLECVMFGDALMPLSFALFNSSYLMKSPKTWTLDV